LIRALLRLVVPSVAALAAMASCSDGPTPQECSDIPKGGCPLSRGVACEDPACEATYACRENNVWELAERCPPREAGGPTDAFVPLAPDAPLDASIDAPPGAYGGPGCPSLVAPDCALGVALACGGAGCCGCEDLFVCENGGWDLWGVCGPSGPEPR
jgi:hypothetical protein